MDDHPEGVELKPIGHLNSVLLKFSEEGYFLIRSLLSMTTENADETLPDKVHFPASRA